MQGILSVRPRRKAIEQKAHLKGLLKAAFSMETADEQTNRIQLALAMTKQLTIERRVLVHPSLALATLNVVYVMGVINTKELVLLKAKGA